MFTAQITPTAAAALRARHTGLGSDALGDLVNNEACDGEFRLTDYPAFPFLRQRALSGAPVTRGTHLAPGR